MPVILGSNDYAAWLDPENTDAEKLLTECPSEALECYETDTYVNNALNEGPQCIERVSPKAEFLFDKASGLFHALRDRMVDMKRLRFNLRTLLIAVALVAVFIGYAQWRRHSILREARELESQGFTLLWQDT